MPLVLTGLAIAGLVWLASRKYASGEGPYDAYPSGFSGRAPSSDPHLTATSGRWYRVESWRPNAANETYHVAFLGETDAYISYVQNRASGQRNFFRANAVSPAQLAGMKVDFGL